MIGLSQNEQVLFNLELEPGTLKYKFDVIRPGEYDIVLSVLIGDVQEPLVLITKTITINPKKIAEQPFELLKNHLKAVLN